ncbi:MAG: DUF3971 domain-containing protein [Gammaproteobacteria bacterium]
MNALLLRSMKILSAFALSIFAILCLILVFIPTVINKQENLTSNISNLIHQPITISKVTVGWSHLDPVLQLKNVILYDSHTQHVTLTIAEIEIGFDLWRALFKHEVAFGLVHISGVKLVANEIHKNIFVIEGVNRAPAFDLKNLATSQTDDFVQIEKLGYIDIDNVDLTVNLLNGKKLQLDKVYLISENFRGYHHFRVHFDLIGNKIYNYYMIGNLIGGVYENKNLKSEFVLKTNDFKIQGKLDLQKKSNDKTNIFLLLHVPRFNLTKLNEYLPNFGINGHLKEWLSKAARKGFISNTELLLNGNLDDFPFDKQNGIFYIKTKFTDLDLFYQKNWPVAENLNGTLQIYDRLLVADVKTGMIKHTKIDVARIILPDIGKSKPQRLILHALFSGQLAHGMDFLQTGPLFKKIGNRLLNLRLFGPMQLRLHLNIPLAEDEKDHTIRAAGTISLHDANVTSTDWNVSIQHINGDLQFTQDDLFADSLKGFLLNEPVTMHIFTIKDFTNVDFIGKLNFNNFAKTYPVVLLDSFDGTSDFSAHLSLAQDRKQLSHLNFYSNLQGVLIDLPKPFSKPKMIKKVLKMVISFSKEQPMTVKVNYDKTVQANILFDLIKKERVFKKATFEFVDPLLTGSLILTSTNVLGDFKKLYWFSSQKVKKIHLAPEQVIKTKIKIAQFYLNNHLFGSVNILAEPKNNAVMINQFQITNPSLNFNATGEWDKFFTRINGVLNITSLKSFFNRLGLNYQIQAEKVESRFHFIWNNDPFYLSTSNLKGNLQFKTGHGVIPSFSKKQNDQLDFGRMLTLLSVESIPRRLTFDFSDITTRGFSFDGMKGSLQFDDGLITTNDLLVHAIMVDILAKGTYDMSKSYIHFKLSVQPKLLASLPVILAIAQGPVVGLATLGITWATQPILKHVFAKCYVLDGPFSKPVVEKCKK